MAISRREKPKKPPHQPVWIYGRHAVAAALANPARKIRRVAATKNARDWLEKNGADPAIIAKLEDARPEAIDRLLHAGAVHQGLAAQADDLPRTRLKDACSPAELGRPVLVLDQITDPQNIGALFRSAAAFNARAVIVQERRTPPLSGALAKAAAGAIEMIPCVPVVNIARAIEGLQGLGYFCAGLAGEAENDIAALPASPLALVMGAEGAGLRQLVGETCDGLYRIPIAPGVESLNVSNAAAISLYEAARAR
jgi:23S rRNA (guanosine2251-2'-O)-methyltransferase